MSMLFVILAVGLYIFLKLDERESLFYFIFCVIIFVIIRGLEGGGSSGINHPGRF